MPDFREQASELLSLITAALPMATEGEGSEPLTWDENDQCALTFDDTIAVVMSLNEVVEAIFMVWILGELPTDPQARVDALQELLEANHEWNLTEGGTLGLDAETGAVTLSYRVDLPLDEPAVIQDIIAKLYNIGQHWQKTLTLSYPEPAPVSSKKKSVRDTL